MDGYLPVEHRLIDELGLTAAALYSLIRSRWEISAKNGDRWRDGKGVFCRFSRREMCKALKKSRPTITKAMRALVKAGYLAEKRVGLTATNKIYMVVDAMKKFVRKTVKPDTIQKEKNGQQDGNKRAEVTINTQKPIQKQPYTTYNPPAFGKMTFKEAMKIMLIRGEIDQKQYDDEVVGFQRHNYANGELENLYADIMNGDD